jgi:hypothetical protein
MIQAKIIGAALLGLALLGSAGAAMIYRAKAHEIQAQFDAFKAEQSRKAAEQRAENERRRHETEMRYARLEIESAEQIAADRDAYAADRSHFRDQLEQLRHDARRAGAKRVPDAAGAAAGCPGPAENERFLDAFSKFEAGISRLIEDAQRQTQTLTTAQAALKVAR